MKRLLVAVGLGVLFMGCVADSGWKVAYEQERANRQEQESRIRNLEAQQRQQPQQTQQQTPTPPQPPAQQSAQPKATIAEVVEKCRKLQANKNFPIGCRTGVYEGTPYIEFAFVNIKEMQQYWDTITKIFLEDFCGRHNDAGNKAMVFVQVVQPEPGAIRGGACFNDYVSEWKPLKETTSSSNNRY
jgi:hypothetical protein